MYNRMYNPWRDKYHPYIFMCYVYDNVCIWKTIVLHVISIYPKHRKCKFTWYDYWEIKCIFQYILIYFWMWILAKFPCVGFISTTKYDACIILQMYIGNYFPMEYFYKMKSNIHFLHSGIWFNRFRVWIKQYIDNVSNLYFKLLAQIANPSY